jgi:hypothetical protein
LHVEAVWGVKLPPIEQREIALLPGSAQPDWRLYAADLTEERILIWREEIEPAERANVLEHLDRVWSLPMSQALPGVSREVAFRLAAAPVIELDKARHSVRLLTPDDHALIEEFWPGEAERLLQPEPRPLVGVVVAGHLLSLAHSSRRTAEACELGIDTLRQARRRGYALAATVVWSAMVEEEGLAPLYSALAENTASLRLAVAAGYRQFARAATIV